MQTTESSWWREKVRLMLRGLLSPPHNQAWEARVDVPLLLLAGVGVGLLDTLWMVRFHLVGWPLTASDFSQYCDAVVALTHGASEQVPLQRSVVAGLLPALFARELGVVGGLAAAAGVSACLLVGGIYLWARTLAGREVGVLAALLTGTIGPILLLSRTITFYPEATAGVLLASGFSIAFLRWRNSPVALLAGLSLGLALCLDVRNVLYVLPALGVSLWAVLLSPGAWGWRSWRLLLLLGPVYLSWWVAHQHVSFQTPGLLLQTAYFLRDAQRIAGHSQWVQISGHDFLWGRSLPWELPGGIQAVQRLTEEVAQQLKAAPNVATVRDLHVGPWQQPTLFAILGMVWALRHQPLLLVASVGLMVPYLGALVLATQILPHARYLGMSMAPLPVLLALGLVGAYGLSGQLLERLAGLTRKGALQSPAPSAQPGGHLGAALVRLGLVLLLVLGVVPSPLSPTASWRQRLAADEYPRVLMQTPRKIGPSDPSCLQALTNDAKEGRSWSGFGISTDGLMPAGKAGDVPHQQHSWRPGPGDKPGRTPGPP